MDSELFRYLTPVCGESIARIASARFDEANTATRARIRSENCFMGKKGTRGGGEQHGSTAPYIAILYPRQGHNPCGPRAVRQDKKYYGILLEVCGTRG